MIWLIYYLKSLWFECILKIKFYSLILDKVLFLVENDLFLEAKESVISNKINHETMQTI